MTARIEQFCDSGSRSRPSSELWIQHANAPDYSECDGCADQHCSWPTLQLELSRKSRQRV
eukprot:5331771-Pyramimonas_sp.AAC.1